jgi:hypothetical protein
MSAANVRSALVILARTHPALWEILGPRGPGPAYHSASVLTAAPLNPQPLPPLLPEEIAPMVRSTAAAIADTAIAANFGGGDGRQVIEEAIDDWCGTPPGGFRIPWPRHWPPPRPPGEPYPIDVEAMIPVIQVHAALVFQAYASDVQDRSMSEAFGKSADRLLDTATAKRN